MARIKQCFHQILSSVLFLICLARSTSHYLPLGGTVFRPENLIILPRLQRRCHSEQDGVLPYLRNYCMRDLSAHLRRQGFKHFLMIKARSLLNANAIDQPAWWKRKGCASTRCGQAIINHVISVQKRRSSGLPILPMEKAIIFSKIQKDWEFVSQSTFVSENITSHLSNIRQILTSQRKAAAAHLSYSPRQNSCLKHRERGVDETSSIAKSLIPIVS
jgi:hypothetical protein